MYLVRIFRDSSHLLASDHGGLPIVERPRECCKKQQQFCYTRKRLLNMRESCIFPSHARKRSVAQPRSMQQGYATPHPRRLGATIYRLPFLSFNAANRPFSRKRFAIAPTRVSITRASLGITSAIFLPPATSRDSCSARPRVERRTRRDPVSTPPNRGIWRLAPR